MKKNVFAVIALAALSFTACKKENTTVETTTPTEVTPGSTEGTKYNVATDKSKIDWTGGKVSGDKHTGTLALKEGSVAVKDNKVVGGNFVIDMNSITVTDITDADKKAMLEGHLKGTSADNSDHFFNTGKFPVGTFVLTSVTDENGTQMVEGNLTLKDVTNSVKFPATVTVTDTDVTIVTENFEIDRTKWGVNFNSGSVVQDLAGDKIINDNIILKLNVAATK